MAAAKKKPVKKAKAAPKRERKPQEAKHEPTAQSRAIVERLALTGRLKHDEIAAVIGISDVTLRKYYATELATARGRTVAAVMNSYLENCIGTKGRKAVVDANGQVIEAAVAPRPGDVNAQKHFLDRVLGLAEKHELIPKLPDGGEPGQGMRFTLEFVDPVTNGDGGKAPSR
jgi:hypothetical protein